MELELFVFCADIAAFEYHFYSILWIVIRLQKDFLIKLAVSTQMITGSVFIDGVAKAPHFSTVRASRFVGICTNVETYGIVGLGF